MAREQPSRSNPRGPTDGQRNRSTAPSRGSRARSTETAAPPPPNVPQPLVRLLLVVAFVATAWGVFSQVSKKDDSAEAEAEQAVVTQPSIASLPPSLRMVGTWRYVLSDAEAEKRAEAQASIDAGSDDPISRVMLNQLDLRLKDNLEVTQAGLTITRGDNTESGSWEATEEGDDNLTFVFTSDDRGEIQAQATFTGGDWLSLVLEADAKTQKLRWRRVKPALPSGPTAPQSPPTEKP